MKQIGEDIETYVDLVNVYDKYAEDVKPTVYFLGLSGEVGELTEAIDDVNELEDKELEWQNKVIAELGDIFWYWCGLTNNLKVNYKQIWNIVYSETYSRQSFHKRHEPKMYTTELLKVIGCSGRLIEHLKKSIRDDDGIITPKRLEKIEQKLAETLEHLFGFCVTMDVNPYKVLQKNYDKLYARNEAGTLQGEGDGITKDERKTK